MNCFGTRCQLTAEESVLCISSPEERPGVLSDAQNTIMILLACYIFYKVVFGKIMSKVRE